MILRELHRTNFGSERWTQLCKQFLLLINWIIAQRIRPIRACHFY